MQLASPVVMRLDGTNAEQGRALLKDHLSDRLIAEPTMLEAAGAPGRGSGAAA